MTNVIRLQPLPLTAEDRMHSARKAFIESWRAWAATCPAPAVGDEVLADTISRMHQLLLFYREDGA